MIKKIIILICLMTSMIYAGDFIPVGVDEENYILNKSDFRNSSIVIDKLSFKDDLDILWDGVGGTNFTSYKITYPVWTITATGTMGHDGTFQVYQPTPLLWPTDSPGTYAGEGGWSVIHLPDSIYVINSEIGGGTIGWYNSYLIGDPAGLTAYNSFISDDPVGNVTLVRSGSISTNVLESFNFKVIEEKAAALVVHTNRIDNPHSVTAAQIGALTNETDTAALAALASYAATNQPTTLIGGWYWYTNTAYGLSQTLPCDENPVEYFSLHLSEIPSASGITTDLATGKITIPTAGLYEVIVSANLYMSGTTPKYVGVSKNLERISYSPIMIRSASTIFVPGTSVEYHNFAAGDEIRANFFHETAGTATTASWFMLSLQVRLIIKTN